MRKLIAFLFFSVLLLCQAAWAAEPTVTLLTTKVDGTGLDAITSAAITATGGTTHPLIVICRSRDVTAVEGTDVPLTGITWNVASPQNFTLLARISNTSPTLRSRTTEVWKLDNPTAATDDVTCTSGGNAQSMSATVYEVATNFHSFGTNFGVNTGAANNLTVAVTTTADTSLVLGGFYCNHPDATNECDPFTPVSGTELVDTNTGLNSTNQHGLTDLKISAATAGSSNSLTTTATNVSNWSGVSIEIRSQAPVSAGGLMLMGVD